MYSLFLPSKKARSSDLRTRRRLHVRTNLPIACVSLVIEEDNKIQKNYKSPLLEAETSV